MTRLVTTGYETGDVAEAGVSVVGASATLAVVNTVPAPRAGAYCLKVSSSTSGIANTTKTFSLGAAKTDVWLRVAFFPHTVTTTVAIPFAAMNDASGAVQASLTYLASDGLIRLYRGQVTTLLATASAAFAQDSWHLIEWRMQITNATTGVSEVWLDGTRVINFAGDNVQSSTNLNVLSVAVGQVDTSVTVGSGSYYAFDDIAINDTAGTVNTGRPGDGRVVLLAPTGAGSNTGLTRGGTDSGANWSQVEELPPSLTDYVFGVTAALRDTYALADLPSGVASINVAEVVVLAQNSDAGAGSLGLTVKSGATTNEGSAQVLGTTATYLRQAYETDPATSAAWTTTAINALEAGVTVR